MMKKVRLLCIAPYEGMRELLNNIAARRNDIEIVVKVGDLEDGVRIAAENYDKNFHALISRGGTAECIRHALNIPTFEVQLNIYDVLRTIKMAQNISDRFALVGFPSITRIAEVLRDLLQYDFPIYTIHDTLKACQVLEELKEQGYRFVLGDMITVTKANELGMSSLLITSGIESVETAINDAVRLHSYYADLSARAVLLEELLKNTAPELAVYNSTGNRLYSSLIQEDPLLDSLFLKNIAQVLAGEPLKLMRRMRGNIFSVEGRRLLDGEQQLCLYTVTPHTSVEGCMIRYFSPDDELPEAAPIENFLGTSPAIRNTLEICDRYAAMANPILLLGEIGTGKDQFAVYIHKHSQLQHNTFVVVDCAMMSEKHWHFLLENDNSPLSDSGLTIYIKRLGSAEPEYRKQLKQYLKSSCSARLNRLIFSFTLGSGFSDQDELYLYLLETINCLQLTVPSLAQRVSDIPILAGLYINALNVTMGTQVVGFTPDAILSLQNFTWARNVEQLTRIVRQLVVTSKSAYISADMVDFALERESTGKMKYHRQPPLNLDRPLDAIMRDVVVRVYEEENMNQTRTAKRLGISRSTLWRMLK